MYRCFISILFCLTLFGASSQGQANVLDDCIRFYQKHLSAQKNSRCAMYPSCSRYGQEVFKDGNFIKAMTLTADRLIRCSHDAEFYDATYKYGYRSLVDGSSHKRLPTDVVYAKYNGPYAGVMKWRADRDSILLFVNHLINREKYEQALWEIERKLFFHNSQTDSINRLFYEKKLMCYRGLKDFETGIWEYETEFPVGIKKSDAVNMQAAMLYYCTENYGLAMNSLNKVTAQSQHQHRLEKAYTLKAIINGKQNKYAEAHAELLKAVVYSTDDNYLNVNGQLLKNMQYYKKKSPTLARILSVVPGAGYLYAGHKGSALTAFVINSLLGYATYTSIKAKNYGMAGVCGFLSLSFYIGNINGAGRSAVRYNNRQKEKYISEFERYNHLLIN